MLIYAHRGASATEPENTLRAFRRALEMGADGIEFDVHASADRVPVVIHDRNLARTTNGQGNVDELPLAALSQLDAGQGEQIPTLHEVLDLVADRVHLDIEIKQGGIEREVLAALARHPDARWAISSFDWDVLRAVRAVAPDAELWLLSSFVSDALFTVARELGATAISLNVAAYTDENVARLSEAGLNVVVWTVNDVTGAVRARDLGACGLCTDAPESIMPELRA
ncbi:MAG: glycerophosphoryl diester phosphodiesterase [Thermomicrobiales bacterium]|jgi:glycerophosphoryl diester phosphodiesterase|nr:glycerophosphoryl diester phosphodiesterase [Thermomicrobiales bacterium]